MTPAPPAGPPTGSPSLVVFTDLDGTLLDHETYSHAAAEPALAACRAVGAPVVLVSSKTWAEMTEIHGQLGLDGPYISENGGGVFFPPEGPLAPPEGAALSGGVWRLALGPEYDILIRAFKTLQAETGHNLRGFNEMSLAEIAQRTGLARPQARLAALREFDEPFIFVDGPPEDPTPLIEAAGRLGLKVTVGGRFWHLMGRTDKGRAVAVVLEAYRAAGLGPLSAGLGDSPNDFEMLAAVDIPILVKSRRDYPELARRLPRLRVTEAMGPAGWNQAVLALVAESAA